MQETITISISVAALLAIGGAVMKFLPNLVARTEKGSLHPRAVSELEVRMARQEEQTKSLCSTCEKLEGKIDSIHTRIDTSVGKVHDKVDETNRMLSQLAGRVEEALKR